MRHERGNILFLILLAVVLFAALSYAVTSSMKGGGNNASEESVRVQAAEIVQFLAQVDVALLRMRMSKGIAAEQIDFSYSAKLYGTGAALIPYMDNPTCTVNSCLLFHPEGGGATQATFEKAAVPDPSYFTSGASLHPGHWVLNVMVWPEAGTGANDVVLRIMGVKTAICDEINRQLGIPAAASVTGAYTSAADPSVWDSPGYTVNSNASALTGKNTAGMVYQGVGAGLHCEIWHLLFAR